MELLFILALAFGAMWLMTRRTRKQQKEAADFRSNLAPGQEVMTGSGLFGTVVAVDGDIVTLETSPGVTSRWLRPAIAKNVTPPAVEEDDPEVLGDDDVVLGGGAGAVAGGASSATGDVSDLRVPDDASSLDRDPDEDDDRRR